MHVPEHHQGLLPGRARPTGSAGSTPERWRPEQLDRRNERQDLLATQARRSSGRADLPATPDYKERTRRRRRRRRASSPASTSSSPVPTPSFADDDNVIAATDVWVSDLAIVDRARSGARASSKGSSCEAKTGEPVAGCQRPHLDRGNNNSWSPPARPRRPTRTACSDSTGRPSRGWICPRQPRGPGARRDATTIYLYSNHAAAPAARPDASSSPTARSTGRARRSTSRASCLRVDHAEGQLRGRSPNRDVTVGLQRRRTARKSPSSRSKTNDYGSFCGSFTAPRDRLTGPHDDHVPRRRARQAAVQRRGVQAAEVPGRRSRRRRKPAKLNGDGEGGRQGDGVHRRAVGGAKVRYRVTREVRYPTGSSTTAGGGCRRTAARPRKSPTASPSPRPDGTFTDHLRREAGPRPCRRRTSRRSAYTVTADVTDTTGETRSGDRSRSTVGYTRPAGERRPPTTWQTAGQGREVRRSRTHDARRRGPGGEGDAQGLPAQAAGEGAAAGHPRTAAPLPRRGRAAAAPTPTPPKPDPADPQTLGARRRRSSTARLRDRTATARQELTLQARRRASTARSLETQDQFGKTVTARRSVHGAQPGRGRSSPSRCRTSFAAPKWSLEPGEEFIAALGHRLRRGPGVRRGRAPRQGRPERSGPTPATHAGADQAAGHRGDARRVHRPRHARAREPRLPRQPARRRAVDEQGPDREVGAVRLEAGAGAEGDVHGGRHRAGREEGRRPRWSRRCTTRRSTRTCRTTGCRSSACSARTTRT